MRFWAAASAVALLAGCTARPRADDYERSILEYRRQYEAALTSDTGWLTIAGLWFLTKPRTTFGSDPLNDIVLPASAPPRAGTFELKEGKVTVVAEPGVTFKLGDETFTTRPLRSDAEAPADRFMLGDLQLWVHMSGNRPSIRLRDKQSPLRTHFTGTKWFPVNPAYRVEGTWEPYDKPKVVEVPNILGDIDEMTVPGIVSFTVNGKALKMEAVDEGKPHQLWLIFRDLTSGHETYGAARFIYADAPINGRMIVDFNRAENPPCAYSPYTTCPLPPEQNRLPVRIEAGEKTYE